MTAIVALQQRLTTRVLLLPEMLNPDGEPRAVLVRPGRLPVVLPSLSDATAALRSEVAR